MVALDDVEVSGLKAMGRVLPQELAVLVVRFWEAYEMTRNLPEGWR